MQKKLAIIHFNPFDKYPPAFNFIRYLAGEANGAINVYVITTRTPNSVSLAGIPGVYIKDVLVFKQSQHRVRRLLAYIYFNWIALIFLLRTNPDVIMYYETLSAFAPWFYKTFLKRRARIFVHYHEYTSPGEYEHGMVIARWFHKMEKQLYPKVEWVSHTNQDRMDLFLKDIGHNYPFQTMVLPNYPPDQWRNRCAVKSNKNDDRIGFVYVGALSMETMFVRELSNYITASPTKYYWDIYSGNFTTETEQFVKNLAAGNIHFKGSVEYDNLPHILPRYHVGVILYKGHIKNYIYNAPNKLFEYLAFDLDVLFPSGMKGIMPYVNVNSTPRVLPLEFSDLNKYDFVELLNKSDVQKKPVDYFCNKIYKPLSELILSSSN